MAARVDAEMAIHPLSLDRYHRMIDLGVLGEDDKVELIEGVLVEMSPQGPLHIDGTTWLTMRFAPAVAGRADVRVQGPLTLPGSGSEPEPDVAIVALDAPRPWHPSAALLVIEVAVTSLAFDRRTKARVYGAAGLPEYWIVDVRGEAVEIRTDPTADGYATLRTARAGETISALAFPDVTIDVGALIAACHRS